MRRNAAIGFLTAILILCLRNVSTAQEKESVETSKQTAMCVSCHEKYTPGIVADWRASLHARTTPSAAAKKDETARMVSGDIPETVKEVAVGCFECHSRNPAAHKDNFQHFSFNINVIVTPEDCGVCHQKEKEQYAESKKAYAISNLKDNPVYHALVETVTSLKKTDGTTISQFGSSDYTKGDTCFACHGTELTVAGMKEIETDFGTISVPDIANWPNHGVGRINPDGSRGACTACHPRHGFSIEIARKPYTCAQCHLDPDVPAWNVYRESKHGNIFLSEGDRWNWSAVPWKVGEDFRAPTCAVCHVSQIVDSEGKVIAERSHDFGDRLWVRLFGLIYSVPQPKKGNTHIIRNKDGLPLPSAFTGEPATEYLLNADEQKLRKSKMTAVCGACHSTDYVNGHFKKLDSTIDETNKMTLEATKLLVGAWDSGIADKTNPFDEAIEQNWVKQWLFFSNSIRYGSAMGGPDYAAFKNGWWDLTNNLQEMKDKIDLKTKK